MASKSCANGSQNQINQGQPSIEFVTVTLTTVLNTMSRDVLVKFNAAHRFFFIASVTGQYANSGLWIHFTQLQLPPANPSNTMQPTGTEQWIPLANSNNSAGRSEGRFIKFNRPVQSFYIDADHPAASGAGTYSVTFAGTDDIDFMIAERQ